MNKLCCVIKPLYYCHACDTRECMECWVTISRRQNHFKFSIEEGLKIYCKIKDKYLTSKTFEYYGK